MRKFLFLCLVCVLSACGNDTVDGLKFSKVTKKHVVSLGSASDAPQCVVNVEMDEIVAADPDDKEQVSAAQSINKTVIANILDLEAVSMQQAVDSFASIYAAGYQRNMLPLYRDDMSEPDRKAWYEYRYNISTETRLSRPDLDFSVSKESDGCCLSYLVTLDYYEGGAHGINQLLTMNFDMRTGRQLLLSDFFVPGFQHKLSTLLVEKLMEQVGVDRLDNLRSRGYLYSMDMYPAPNFIVGDDSLTFVYNPYEIAPYAVGQTRLSLSYEDVKDILKH